MEISNLMAITYYGEQWEQIPNYPKYYVSSEGRIYSEYEHNIIKGSYNKKGYHIFELFNDETPKGKHGDRIRLSHLVAAAFCKNYTKDKYVHHINRNRGDDRAINLLAVTREQHNAIHALYDRLFDNIPLLAQLLEPIIHININLLFDDMKGGDVA